MPSDAVLYQAAALCLTYPDDDFRARLPLLREAAPQLREFTVGDVYRAHGLEFSGEELPDFLPAVLEFTARTGDIALLTEHREALEQLRSRLTEFGTPYACVLDAVCATLPGVSTGEG